VTGAQTATQPKLQRRRAGDGRQPVYTIADTAITVSRLYGQWRLGTADLNDDADRWLRRNQLTGHDFPTRNGALRAYQAAAAIDPPPNRDAPALPTLRRIAPGQHTSGDITVTRPTSSGWWTVTWPDGATAHADSLREAARIIETRQHVQQLKWCPPHLTHLA